MPRKKKGLIRKRALQAKGILMVDGEKWSDKGVHKREKKLHKRGKRSGKKKRCFSCGSAEHAREECTASSLEREQFRKQQKIQNTICFGCRERGHSLKECQNLGKGKGTICYNCGASGHQLKECTKPKKRGGLKYATCFICTKTGHIAKNCPKNNRGLYPNGGGCLHCGSIEHLVANCDKRISEKTQNLFGDYDEDVDDEEDTKKKNTESQNVVHF